jgi:hypothetical protein
MIRRNRDHISYASVGTFALERDSPVWNDPTRYQINLLEAHVPYALAQNYTTADAPGPEADRQRARLDRRLAELHAEFADLDPIFERAVDRSFAMFMAVAQDGRPDVPDDAGEPAAESFRSPSLDRTVTVDLDRWKMRVNP